MLGQLIGSLRITLRLHYRKATDVATVDDTVYYLIIHDLTDHVLPHCFVHIHSNSPYLDTPYPSTSVYRAASLRDQ